MTAGAPEILHQLLGIHFPTGDGLGHFAARAVDVPFPRRHLTVLQPEFANAEADLAHIVIPAGNPASV